MSNNASSKIYHSHDHVFRNAMSDLRVARDFIQAYLPADVTEKIDLDTLKFCKDTYVDQKLKKLVTDVIYTVDLKNKIHDTPAYISLLFEHISNAPKFTAWDMLLYSCRAIENIMKQNEFAYMPVIIPIVVYNGRNKYPHSTSIFDLFVDSHKDLAKKYMFNQFLLIDFSQISDEKMRQHKWSNLMELIMKHSKSRDFMNQVESLFQVFKNRLIEANDYALGMLHYIIEHTDTNDGQRFEKLITQLSTSSLEVKNMTLGQLWEQRGYEKGEQSGYQKAMQEIEKKNMTLAQAWEQRGYEKGEQSGYQKAMQEIEKKNMTLAQAWEQRGYEKGEQSGYQKAMQEIEKKIMILAQEKAKNIKMIERFEIAKKLLIAKANLEFISQITELSIEEIKQIQKEIEEVLQ